MCYTSTKKKKKNMNSPKDIYIYICLLWQSCSCSYFLGWLWKVSAFSCSSELFFLAWGCVVDPLKLLTLIRGVRGGLIRKTCSILLMVQKSAKKSSWGWWFISLFSKFYNPRYPRWLFGIAEPSIVGLTWTDVIVRYMYPSFTTKNNHPYRSGQIMIFHPPADWNESPGQ